MGGGDREESRSLDFAWRSALPIAMLRTGCVTNGVKEFEGDGGNPTQSSNVACVVNYYGPSDFTESYGHSVDAAEVLPLLLGGDLEEAHSAAHRGQPALLGDAERGADVLHSGNER